MNNKLLIIQEMLMNEMERLSEKEVDRNEISRSNALTNNALTFIKSINLGLRIKETAEKYNITTTILKKEIGLDE